MNPSIKKLPIMWDLWFIGVLVVLCNVTLITGRPMSSLLFSPGRIASGEWWCAFTGFFVHVSFYHLLLDAGAFLMLLHSLREFALFKRAAIVVSCAVGSVVASLPVLGSDGTLCGLSGIAHGLLAVMALEMTCERDLFLRRAGAGCFAVVLLKSLYEAVSGHVLFESMHLGSVETPVAICHAGGVLGGILMYAALKLRHSMSTGIRWTKCKP